MLGVLELSEMFSAASQTLEVLVFMESQASEQGLFGVSCNVPGTLI